MKYFLNVAQLMIITVLCAACTETEDAIDELLIGYIGGTGDTSRATDTKEPVPAVLVL